MSLAKYVALLRGINVGGNTKVRMADLKESFTELGFKNIKTLLNSGNLIFETSETDPIALAQKIDNKLSQAFGFNLTVLLRTDGEIRSLVKAYPFKKIKNTLETRLYVTFLTEPGRKSTFKIPDESPEKDFQILKITDKEICSMLTLSPKWGTVDLMKLIEKEFGKQVTTRNWNTILKINALFEIKP